MFKKIKQARPLILNLTNGVTTDFVANGLLSLGASPVMTNAQEEIEDLVKIADAVVINLGTLNQDFIQLCQKTCAMANRFDKPIIMDPVGAGASRYRTEMSLKLLSDYRIAIIRANASEVMALAGEAMQTKGVDSIAETEHAIHSAHVLSQQFDSAIVVSGKTDVIVDQGEQEQFMHGSALMPMVTGTGCLLSAVVAAFHAIEKKRFRAACDATVAYGICGELAAKKTQAPGSFKTHFLDILYEN